MKHMMKAKRAAAAALAASVLLLVGCSNTSDGGQETTAPVTQPAQSSALHFVAADKTSWDKEVNIGEYAYTLSVDFNGDGTLTLDGTCTGRAQAESTQGRGGPGGGESTEDTTPTQAPLTEEEMRAQDFEKTGTWVLETGYGYTTRQTPTL